MNLKFSEQNTRLEKAFWGNLSSPYTRVGGSWWLGNLSSLCRWRGRQEVGVLPGVFISFLLLRQYAVTKTSKGFFSGPRFYRCRCPQAGNTWQQEQETARSCSTTDEEQEVATAIKPQSPCLQ